MRNAFSQLLILTFALLAWIPGAFAVDFVVWRPLPNLHPLVLAVPKGMTPAQAAEAYQRGLREEGTLDNVFAAMDSSGGSTGATTRYPDLPTEHFERFDANPDDRVMLIGNTGGDLEPGFRRVVRFGEEMAGNKQRMFILPPVGDVHVPASEIAEYDQKLSELFSMAITPGGPDFDPVTYGEKDNGSRNYNLRRDRSELRLLRSLMDAGVFVVGVCRGSQAGAIARGGRLTGDIPSQKPTEINHNRSWHEAASLRTTNNLLRRIVGLSRFMLLSYHHQEVDSATPLDGGEIALAADDGITEAWELENGRGLFMQFHPEFMKNSLSARIFRGIIAHKNRLLVRSCGRVF